MCAWSAAAQLQVTNRITDALTQAPVPQARVYAAWHAAGQPGHAVYTTDAEGTAVCVLPAHAVEPQIGISVPRYAPVWFVPRSNQYALALRPARSYALRGRISDGAGRPVAQARVVFCPDDAAYRDAVRGCDVWSGEDGTFVMTGVPVAVGPGAVHVIARAHVSITDNRYRVSPRDGDAFVVLQVQDGITVRGRIHTDDGRGMPSARVWARQALPEESTLALREGLDLSLDPLPGCVTHSTDDGAFVLGGIPENAYVALHADHPGAASAATPPMIARELRQAPVALCLHTQQMWLALDVRDPQGTVITNLAISAYFSARVTTGRHEFVHAWRARVAHRVLPDARVLAGPVPPESASSLVLSASGFSKASVPVMRPYQATNRVTCVLTPPRRVTLSFVDALTAQPVTNARVLCEGQALALDAGGRVQLELEDTVRLDVTAPGYGADTHFVNPFQAEQTILLALPFAARVQVYQPDGTPVTHGFVYVEFVQQDYTAWGATHRVDTRGVADLSDVRARAPLAVFHARHSSQGITLASAALSNIVPSVTYHIALTQAATRALTVCMPRAAGEETDAPPACLLRRAAPDTHRMHHYLAEPDRVVTQQHRYCWQFNTVVTGAYEVFIHHRDGRPSIRTNIVLSFHAPEMVEIAYDTSLRAALEVIARSEHSFNAPLFVEVKNATGARGLELEDGRARFTGLLTGVAYTVSLQLLGTALVSEVVLPCAAPVYFDVPPPVRVRGRLEFPHTVAERATILLGPMYAGRFLPGFFELPPLVPGTHSFAVVVPGYAATNITLHIESGEDVDAGVWQLQPVTPVSLRGRLPGTPQTDLLVSFAGGALRTKTDQTGAFIFTNLTPALPVFLLQQAGHGFTPLTNLALGEVDMDIGDLLPVQ